MRVKILKELLDQWLSKNNVTSEQLAQHIHDLVDEKLKGLEARLVAAIDDKLGELGHHNAAAPTSDTP